MKLNLKHILIVVCVLLSTTGTFAGKVDKGYKALSSLDYFKAKKLFTKGLKYNESASAQGLAVIYFRNDNPFHSYDSAYFYINLSIQGWDMAKQRKKDKWAQYGYTEDSLFAFRQKISTEFYKIADERKTEAALSEFLEMHPWANERASAIATRDSIAFFNAVRANDAISYKAFVDKYPESTYAELARQNYFDSQFFEQTADGSLNSFVQFIEVNPESPMRPLAEKSVFNLVTAPNNQVSFETFIKDYPKNPYLDTAWRQLYQFMISDYSKESMEAFLQTDTPFKSDIHRDLALMDSISLPFINDAKYGFMNTDGQVMVQNDYDFAGFFQEGLAIVVINEKYGFVNKQGEQQIKCMFESASDFNGGRAIVELNGKIGMIDRNGRFIF